MGEQGVPNSNRGVKRDGRIGHILLDRPKALNALDRDMMRAIQAAPWPPPVHAKVIDDARGQGVVSEPKTPRATNPDQFRRKGAASNSAAY